MWFLCHRQGPHCYEERFRPYYGEELDQVVSESQANYPRIIDDLPGRMTFLDAADGLRERIGRIILAGGEILLDPVRESVLYPALLRLHQKYERQGGVQLIVQTTGDTISAKMVRELLDRHVNLISVSGIDSFHAGLEKAEARDALQARLPDLLLAHGMKPYPTSPDWKGYGEGERPFFTFFSATPDSWLVQA